MQAQQIWGDVLNRKLMKFVGTVQTISGPDRDVQTFQSQLEQLQMDAKGKDDLKNCEMLVCQDNYFCPVISASHRWSSTTLEQSSVRIQWNTYISTTKVITLLQ